MPTLPSPARRAPEGRLAAAFGAAALALAAAAPACAAPALRVFFDNDFLGPGESDIQALLPLFDRKDVQVDGIGVVTGDGWLKEETAHTLRFLEIAKRTEIPVYEGAETPLLRTPTEMRAWELQYGVVPWKGAWSSPTPRRSYHPEQPRLIPPMPEGTPTTSAQAESAVTALVRLVRAHPGQITIVAAGPLTDIALALRMAPDLPALAKEIICEGGKFDNETAQVTDNTDYETDFNFLFDPEAAHIVLTAPWRRITVVGNVAADIRATPEIIDRIGRAGAPVARYLEAYAVRDLPFWDEITTAVAVDPTLITKEMVAYMDVDILPGPHYGRARVWNDKFAPHAGEQKVHVIQAIDAKRFVEGFVAAATR